MCSTRTGARWLLVTILIAVAFGLTLSYAWAAPIAGQELVAPTIAGAPAKGLSSLEAWVLLRKGYVVRQAHWTPGKVWVMALTGALAYCTFEPAADGVGILGYGWVIADLSQGDDQADWEVVGEGE